MSEREDFTDLMGTKVRFSAVYGQDSETESGFTYYLFFENDVKDWDMLAFDEDMMRMIVELYEKNHSKEEHE